MRHHRFYIKEKIQGNASFTSTDERLVHQLRDVFRMKKGDRAILFDDSKCEFFASVNTLTRKEVVFDVEEGEVKEEKHKREVHLCLSIIKKDNFELAIEKAVELGVASITPVVADRSQYKEVRLDRLEKIVIEAVEQSGRVSVPHIDKEKTVSEIIEKYPDVIVLDMDGVEQFSVSQKSEVTILVGPEGGWSDAEREMFAQKNIQIVSLPFNTLRAETAVIVAGALAGI